MILEIFMCHIFLKSIIIICFNPNSGMYRTIFLTALLAAVCSQNMSLLSETSSISMIASGVRNQSFYQYKKELDCGMPELYIYPDDNRYYIIETANILIYSVVAKWRPIYSSVSCNQSNCLVNVNNQCSSSSAHQINWIVIDSSAGEVEYLIDCNPSSFYKPFQWGLLLLIMLCTLMLTLSSRYSTAWSYGGVGFDINYKFVGIFNVVLFVGLVFAYQFQEVTSFIVRVVGTVIGALGVMVCVSELIWLTHNKNYLKKVYRDIRMIDVISGCIGIFVVTLYWLLNGQWIINDVLATCTIIALMKLLKIRSLAMGVLLLGSLLLMEIMVGVVVHYVRKVSYNNFVINLFQSPIILVIPSITHQLYRKCAWMPISTILFPGLVISYLRRFDKSRGTFIYFVIGLVSFYLGSICWMVIDLETVHSLPFAIISEPVTIIIVAVHGLRRNQFKTLWRGNFHDEQLQEATQILISKLQKSTQIVGNVSESDYPTEHLRITIASQEIDVMRQSDEFKL